MVLVPFKCNRMVVSTRTPPCCKYKLRNVNVEKSNQVKSNLFVTQKWTVESSFIYSSKQLEETENVIRDQRINLYITIKTVQKKNKINTTRNWLISKLIVIWFYDDRIFIFVRLDRHLSCYWRTSDVVRRSLVSCLTPILELSTCLSRSMLCTRPCTVPGQDTTSLQTSPPTGTAVNGNPLYVYPLNGDLHEKRDFSQKFVGHKQHLEIGPFHCILSIFVCFDFKPFYSFVILPSKQLSHCVYFHVFLLLS